MTAFDTAPHPDPITLTDPTEPSAGRDGAATRKPIVLVPACNRPSGDHLFHMAGKKYVDAVRLAGCTPLIVPTAEPGEFAALLALADGLLLTGSKSNVHPRHFDEAVHDPSLPLDPERDAWTLALIPLAIARGLPMFAICRGAQETNVALGGTLYQAVHEFGHEFGPEVGKDASQGAGPFQDHRAPDGQSAERQYAPAHRVDLVPGGLLAALGLPAHFEVNSLHGQAVRRLAPGLRAEALAPDGLVEAFSLTDAPGFNLCVQWHPEWLAADNPVSMQMLQAFGAAASAYRDRRATAATASRGAPSQ
jgi:putative glutamine amidotransferase